MKNISRITLFIVIFIGGSLAFRYWALDNFNLAFSDFDKVSVASSYIKETSKNEIISGEIVVPVVLNETTKILPVVEKEIKPEDLSFIFPLKGSSLYQGCKYDVILDSSSSINNIDYALVDVGTRTPIGPVSSGLPKNAQMEIANAIEWKVGNVWPGAYYILTSNINDKDIKKRSDFFNIKKIPSDVNLKDIEDFCKNN